MTARMSTLILSNILDALVDLVGEEAVTTVIRVAMQRTAENLITTYNINVRNLSELAKKIKEIVKKELETDIDIVEESNGKIVIRVQNCKFYGHEGQTISKVSEILGKSKLCILALLCLSLIEKVLEKRYDVGALKCEKGNAIIEILSPELYLKK